eukprot:gene18197-23859_t
MDTQWFERFLCDYLEDLSVNVSEWKSTNDNTKTRNIRSLHPSKVSFPGLPSHAESLKTQIITFSKELFNVNPSDVISRIINSFLPSLHSPILLKPDIYGPLLAVFMLPQALLLSMDTSRHGCSQNSVLGNAVIVSICLWGGLSSLYRLLSFVIAPTIGIKHCLSMTGYSFFGWTLALLCSYPLERYNQQIGLPIALPIVLFGVPSAIALGYMFWEQTPASSLTIQPASFPTSLQNFAHNNSRILQKLLWAVPKIIAFILVSGTHYQFLWYVARVFLPGKQQQCELSALIQPAQYADIITQKELRKYALILLNGGTN